MHDPSLPQTITTCMRQFIRALLLLIGSGMALTIVCFCSILAWWVLVDCAPGPSPRLYPGAAPTERVERITAVIATVITTESYLIEAPLDAVQRHYDWELLWVCEPGSRQAFASSTNCPAAGGCITTRCHIKGWNNGQGSYTFYPTGGYTYHTTHFVDITLQEQPDGRVQVIHIEDFSQGC